MSWRGLMTTTSSARGDQMGAGIAQLAPDARNRGIARQDTTQHAHPWLRCAVRGRQTHGTG